ncbi:hypothetical protein [Rhizomonospora bruguierae]|uniref:hypothetical protein n=1 Tax=Rhizomonospora bruguierae TaxID=1581705 RepID=UPI001BCB0947|nr:hypothetical protein [Micromonospora sp. NBRC 107566]
MNDVRITLITVVLVLSAIVWFDRRVLADLAHTSDRELRYFDRRTWAFIIVLPFPIGPMLYLVYGRGGPRRFP